MANGGGGMGQGGYGGGYGGQYLGNQRMGDSNAFNTAFGQQGVRQSGAGGDASQGVTPGGPGDPAWSQPYATGGGDPNLSGSVAKGGIAGGPMFAEGQLDYGYNQGDQGYMGAGMQPVWGQPNNNQSNFRGGFTPQFPPAGIRPNWPPQGNPELPPRTEPPPELPPWVTPSPLGQTGAKGQATTNGMFNPYPYAGFLGRR